jgi:hypothetical protein
LTWVNERYRDFSPIWPPYSSSATLSGTTDMQESAKLRRGKLIEEIRRYRHTLFVMKLGEQIAPSPPKEAFARHNQEIAEKLRSMENELHELNVQLIREEISGDTFGQSPKPLDE